MKKIRWFLDYYLKTTLFLLLGIGVAIYFILSFFGLRDEQKIGLNVLILDDRITEGKIVKMGDFLQNEIGEQVDISGYGRKDQNQRDAFAVKTTTDGIDIVIAPHDEMQMLYENKYISEYEETTKAALWYEKLMEEESEDTIYIASATRGDHPENGAKIRNGLK